MLSNHEGISWETRCIVYCSSAPRWIAQAPTFSPLPLHRFQRPSVNHEEGLELGPLMCRQRLWSPKIGIEIRAGQAGVVGGAAGSP